MSKTVEKIWEEYIEILERNGGSTEQEAEAWHFCSNKKDADELAELVLAGTKRATAYLCDLYEIEGEELTEVGELNVITDWDGNAKCITRVTKVSVLQFKNVTEEMAFIEGEGDKSLQYWKQAHIDVFTQELKELNMLFNEDIKIVFEEFEVVHK